jgi:hypothetical protein
LSSEDPALDFEANLLRNSFANKCMTQDDLAIPEQGIGEQSSSPAFRREFVSKVVSDICEGRLVFRVDQQGRRPEDIELVSSTVGRLVGYINDYVAGTKAAEEFEFLEKQLFFCVTVLRTYDALKPNVNEANMEATLRNLEAKVDSIGLQLAQVMSAVSKHDEPAIKKSNLQKRKLPSPKKRRGRR